MTNTHLCQCPRTDTDIGRGECFRETEKLSTEAAMKVIKKERSGCGKSGAHTVIFKNSRTHFCTKA